MVRTLAYCLMGSFLVILTLVAPWLILLAVVELK
jgi:hypothetical protein